MLGFMEVVNGQERGGHWYTLERLILGGDNLAGSGVFYSEILHLRLCNGVEIVTRIVTWIN